MSATPEAWEQSGEFKVLALLNGGKLPLYDPNTATVTMVDLFVCENCGRATTTGLCGCSNQQPIAASRSGSRDDG